MAGDDSTGLPGVPKTPLFATTQWTVVLAAAETQSPDSAEALEKLCLAYWHPLYVYVRRKGCSPEEAQDLTQEFFARLIEKKLYQAADRSRGRFRWFLLTMMQNFLAQEHRKATAQKRGGGAPVYSLDFQDAEGRYLLEPSHDLTPERLFDRAWARSLLNRVLERLRQEYEDVGQGKKFEALSVCLVDVDDAGSYADIAGQLGMSEGAIKTAVHRLRRRYRALYRQEISQLVEREDEVEEEIRQLFSALAS